MSVSNEPRASLVPRDNPFDRAVRVVNRFTALQLDDNSIEPDTSILEPFLSQDLSILNDSEMNDSFSKVAGPNTSFIRGRRNPFLKNSKSSIYSNVSLASTYSINHLKKTLRIGDQLTSVSVPDFDVLPPSDDERDFILSPDELTSVSRPDFDVLPPSDDESKSVQLLKSPRSLPKERVGSEFENPQKAQSLDDLANTCDLDCDSNAELLAVSLKPPAQGAQHQIIEEENKNVELTMENLKWFVQHSVQALLKIDPATKQLLNNLEQNLQRIREETESTKNKEITKTPSSNSLSSLRTSTTPYSRIETGISTLRNLLPKKSPTEPPKINDINSAEILKNPITLSLADSLLVADTNRIVDSTPIIIRRSISQIQPRNLNTMENSCVEPSAPRENRKPTYSPIKVRSPRRRIPIFFKAKKQFMSLLKTNNQKIKIKSTSKPSRNDKENQY